MSLTDSTSMGTIAIPALLSRLGLLLGDLGQGLGWLWFTNSVASISDIDC